MLNAKPNDKAAPRTIVSVNHEFGTLKEVIIGSQPRDTFTTIPYESTFDGWMRPRLAKLCKEQPNKRIIDIDPAWAIGVEEQLENVAKILESRGVKVHRAVPLSEKEQGFNNPNHGWSWWFVRDPSIVIGNNIIEAAPLESWRQRERFAVRPIMKKIFNDSDARWVAMPFPSPDSLPDDPRIEGGDVIVNGREIYVGVMKEGNPWVTTPNGVKWLQRYLGSEYKVIQIDSNIWHLDGVLSLLQPGLGVRCPEAINELRGEIKDWNFVDVTLEEALNLGCNSLILDEKTIMMDTRPVERVANEIEKKGVNVIHVDFDAITDTVGGLRCSTQPIWRDSKL